jgi:hypothetical protein
MGQARAVFQIVQVGLADVFGSLGRQASEFGFNRRDYGRLRQLIDVLNGL